MYRIYIVEDDRVISQALCDSLNRWGFEAAVAEDFSDIMGEFDRIEPHLVLMDVSLPFYNGYFWCEKIRRASQIPVVFLSSRADTANVVMAVNMGADDYIAKPVDAELLIAKVQAVLRRSYDYETTAPACIGEVQFDLAGCCLLNQGERIPLTKNESKILQQLLSAHGAIVSRETLMLALWNSDAFVDENTLSVNVNRLRRTLAAAGAPDCIVTHKGQGYSLDA